MAFDTLIVHPTAKMHSSVNIIRLSNVHTERISSSTEVTRGSWQASTNKNSHFGSCNETTDYDGITSDKCKLEGKADRGVQRLCLIRH